MRAKKYLIVTLAVLLALSLGSWPVKRTRRPSRSPSLNPRPRLR